MKFPLALFFPLVTPISTVAASLLPLREHVDLHWTYEAGEGWICEAKTIVGGDDVLRELDEVYLPIDDRPHESGGQRHTQPEGEAYAFTGVEPGGPIWIAPQIEAPGQCWPGFNNYQATDTFGIYQESDARLSSEDTALFLPWIRISLLGVSYQGPEEARFSMWRSNGFEAPTVWFSSSENENPDTFLTVAGDHVHLNWGFGSPGIYRIRLSASAYEGPGQNNPTGESEPFTVTFAIGQFAQWQAEHFTAAELDDPTVSGPSADADRDGMTNRIEFAFGFHPREASTAPITEGLGLPRLSLVTEAGVLHEVLEYPCRRAGDQWQPLIYTPGFSPDLSAWHTQGVSTTTADFPAEQEILNAVWKKAVSRRPVGSANDGRGFARVAVE
jgi:surface-anchored protein